MILPAFTALLAESIPKTGSAFIPSLLLKEGFTPTPSTIASDAVPTDVGEFLKMQANGKHDVAENPAPYVGFTTRDDDPQRYRDRFHELYEGGNLQHENAQAADRYENLAQSAVPSFLVCATTLKTDGTISDPFLAVVAFPTAFRKGNTRRKIWSGTKPATLMPGNITGPELTAYVVMASMAQNSRDLVTMPSNERSPNEYIQRDTVICFSENGSLFSSVVASAQTAPGIRNTAFSDKYLNLRAATWKTADEMRETANSNDTWTANTPDEGDGICVRLSKFLPLPCPCVLPPGILGSPTLGAAGMKAVCQHYWDADDDEMSAWIDEPITLEWLTAVAANPASFTSHWIARKWIEKSVTETLATPGFATTVDRDLWLTAERTLAFRLHLDYLRHRYTGSMGKNLERYLHRAWEGLCTANSPSGYLPIELFGELCFYRFPKTKAWDLGTAMNFSTWTCKSSVPPNMRAFLCYAVPSTANSVWNQPPLETQDEAIDRMAEEGESDDMHEDSELAAARSQQRAESATKRKPPPELTNGGPPDDDNEGQADGWQAPAARIGGRPPAAAPAGNELPSQTDVGHRSGGRDEQGRKRRAQDPHVNLSRDNNDSDDNEHDQRKPSARGGVQRARREVPERAEIVNVDSPPLAQRRRDPRLYQARGDDDVGYSPYRDGKHGGAARSPARTGGDWMQVNERRQHNHPRYYDEQPPVARRRNDVEGRSENYSDLLVHERTASRQGLEFYAVAAAVAASTTTPELWELLKPKKGQPENFGFLSAILFKRQPDFQGYCVDTRGQAGRGLVQHERNFPANIGTRLRKDFLAEKDSAKAALWIAGEAHSCQAYASGARQHTAFYPYPPRLSFDRLPATTVEAFRSGNWRCSTYTSRDGPSVKHFSAFSILTLLEGNSALPLLPCAGLSFKLGMKAVECLFWLMGLTALSNVNERAGSNPSLVVESTPILRTMHQFITLLRRNEEDIHLSVAAVWESDPPFSQLSVAYTILRDFDELFDLFLRLIKPPGSPSPFITVCECLPTGDLGQDEAAVTSLFTAAASPLDPNGTDAEVNIFAAIQSWMSEKQHYYNKQLPRAHTSQLLAVPDNFVNGKLPRTTQPSVASSTTRQVATSENDSKRRATGKNTNTNTNTNTNEQVPAAALKAAKPLLKWGPLATKEITGWGPMSVIRDIRPKPMMQKRLICIQFTMEGVNNCAKNGICTYAHLDAQGASPDAVKYEPLRKLLDHPTIKGVIVFTDEGKRVAGSS